MSDASPRPSGDRGSAAKEPLVATLFVCLTVGLLLAGTIAPAASAGDTVALFSFDPEEIEAEPGDTVTVDVVLQAHEGYGGAGVDEVSFGVEYDPDVLTVTAIERTQWLEGETAEEESDEVSINVTTNVDDEAGRASIAQARAVDDDDNGSVGTAPVATVTLEVGEDARPTNAALTIVDPEVGLTSSYPLGTTVRDGEIVVDGGGESETEDDDSGDDPEGVTLADDGGENERENEDEDESAANSSADATTDDADEATPGFGALVAMGTLVAAIVVRRRS